VRVAARVVAKANSNREYGEDESSDANKLDKLFTFFGYESDRDLLLALSQSAAKKQGMIKEYDSSTSHPPKQPPWQGSGHTDLINGSKQSHQPRPANTRGWIWYAMTWLI
jgi:hypothetical protein